MTKQTTKIFLDDNLRVVIYFIIFIKLDCMDTNSITIVRTI